MAKNPVEEFLLEKKALGLGGLLQKAKPHLSRMGEAAGAGVMTGAGAAAFAGLTAAAGKLYEAATKTRDFNNMLEANPHLMHHHEADPVGFNRLFSSLRTMAPEFTQEPLVAGAYMQTMLDSAVEQRGQVPVQALRDRSYPKAGPATQAALSGFMQGIGRGPSEKKPQITRSTRSSFRHDPSAADPVLERLEETQHYYG